MIALSRGFTNRPLPNEPGRCDQHLPTLPARRRGRSMPKKANADSVADLIWTSPIPMVRSGFVPPDYEAIPCCTPRVVVTERPCCPLGASSFKDDTPCVTPCSGSFRRYGRIHYPWHGRTDREAWMHLRRLAPWRSALDYTGASPSSWQRLIEGTEAGGSPRVPERNTGPCVAPYSPASATIALPGLGAFICRLSVRRRSPWRVQSSASAITRFLQSACEQ